MDKEVLDRYIICRYLYRIGKSPISDADYDVLHLAIKEAGLLPEYTERSYDDDPIPFDLLVTYGYTSVDVSNNTPRDDSFLIEDKSMSIDSVTSHEEVWSFFSKFKGIRKVLSVKLDGNNIKCDVENDAFNLCLTRGRDSNGFDVTQPMRYIFPANASLPGRFLMRGECFIDESYLESLRKRYDDSIYKTPKSAAISLLLRPSEHSREDYEYLRFYAFSCDGLATSVSETYEKLSQYGFLVPPYLVLENEPETYEDFVVWFESILDDIRDKQGSLSADGLVLEIDDNAIETEIQGMYDNRQIALKYHHWKSKTYTGVIKDVIIEQRKAFCCCKVEIIPIVTDDNSTATIINTFNPSFLIDNGLTIGSVIEFERWAGTVNIMVGGKKIHLDTKEVLA